MQLTPDRRESLKTIIFDTFQTLDDLSRLVRYALDKNLHEIVVVYDRNLDKNH